MHFRNFSFGTIQIDGTTYEYDVVIDRGKIRRRDKTPSKKLRHAFGHTPVSLAEEIPWECRQLVIGTGASGQMPVTPELHKAAEGRNITLLILPTAEAIEVLNRKPKDTNAILHLTC